MISFTGGRNFKRTLSPINGAKDAIVTLDTNQFNALMMYLIKR